MTTRGNIYIRGLRNGVSRAPGVYLYQHGDGYDLPDTLAKALNGPAGRSRGDDAPYLARIIFCEMLKTDQDPLNGATGFGISGTLDDYDLPLLVVDTAIQRVYLVPTGHADVPNGWVDQHPETAMNYEEFIAIATQGYKALEIATDARIGAAADRAKA